ncbi:MAG TPA: ROK family protein [Solirubrobacterales bacterium]
MERPGPLQRAVMHAILAQAESRPSHQQIADAAGVSKRFVTKTISALRSSGILVGGHPARLGTGLGLVLGISIGSETLRAALVDANGAMSHQLEDPARPDQLHLSPEELLSHARGLGARVLSEAMDNDMLRGDDGDLRLLGAAIAWPSPVDREGRPGGTILRDMRWRRSPRSRRPPTLPELTAKEFGPPFAVDRCHALNDANAHAIAIAFDKSQARFAEENDELWSVALVILIGGGLGAATMMLAPHSRSRLSFIDSRLVAGANGFAGELGHSPLPREVISARNRANTFDEEELPQLDYEKAECSCGAKHHLEAFASGRALIRRLRTGGYEEAGYEGDGVGGSLYAELQTAPDAAQAHALFDVGSILGGALANPILMLNPQSITLTGALATKKVCDGVLSQREAWKNAFDDEVDVAPVDADKRDYMGVQGAALAVIRRCIYRSYLRDGVMADEPFAFGPKQLEALGAAASAVAATN